METVWSFGFMAADPDLGLWSDLMSLGVFVLEKGNLFGDSITLCDEDGHHTTKPWKEINFKETIAKLQSAEEEIKNHIREKGHTLPIGKYRSFPANSHKTDFESKEKLLEALEKAGNHKDMFQYFKDKCGRCHAKDLH